MVPEKGLVLPTCRTRCGASALLQVSTVSAQPSARDSLGRSAPSLWPSPRPDYRPLPASGETALGSFAVLCGPGPLASLRRGPWIKTVVRSLRARHWRADRLQFGKSLWPNNKRRQALNHFVDTDSLPAFDAEDPQAEPMNADCWKLSLLRHWAVCRAAHPATPPTPAAR